MADGAFNHPLAGLDPIIHPQVTVTAKLAMASILAFAPKGQSEQSAGGLNWPLEMGRVTETALGMAGLIAPDQWLVLAETGRNGGLAIQVGAADPALRISDQGAGRVAIQIQGSGWQDLLRLGCRLDLDGLSSGAIAQTSYGPIAVTVIRPPGTQDRLLLLATSGYGRALWEALAEATATL